jgi:GT2 family glycosyltransferase
VAETPRISLVVLAWDNLPLTQSCVASIRASTDVSYELIIVDNGSAPEAAAWAQEHADVAVLHEENLGFARGMNAGLAAATCELIAFVNNDTVWPAGWTGPLLEHFTDARVGIVCPAVTAAGNPVTVRAAPSTDVIRLDPFSALPSGVVYVMRTDTARQLGGWTERYRLAMSEDLDLCFTAWSNGLEILIDTRVLIEHVLHGTLSSKLDNQQELWRENLDLFLNVWTKTAGDDIPRLAAIDETSFARNISHARAAAAWLRRLDDERQHHQAAIVKLRDEAKRARARATAAAPTPPTTAARIRRRVARWRRDRA